MDKFTAKLQADVTPKINPLLGNGLAVEHLKRIDEFIDEIFRMASRSYPPGIKYMGFKRCPPDRAFDEITKRKNNQPQQYDVALSYMKMNEYYFDVGGKMITRYMQVPFCGPAGTIYIGGSRMNIFPVLSDRVISVGVSNIFVRLLRARVTFERNVFRYVADDEVETVQVVHSQIYHRNPKVRKLKRTVSANCSLMHYLFCKYGFTETFEKYGGTVPIVGYGGEINDTKYPPDEWIICRTTGLAPAGTGRQYWEKTDIRLAVRRDKYTPMVKNMIGGFFYVCEYFPTLMIPDYIDSLHRWKVLMGHIIFSGTIGAGKLHDDIDDHIKSLDEYLDSLVKDQLKNIGIHVEDFYDLMALIVEKYDTWIIENADKVNSMHGKELNVLYYLCFDITSEIFKMMFKLRAAYKSKGEITVKVATDIMNATIKTGKAFKINRDHGEVSSVSYSGDNKAFKITQTLVPQSGSNRVGSKKDRAVIDDPTKALHISIAEVGSHSNIPKSDPSGHARLNLTQEINPDGSTKRREDRIPLYDEVQALFQHKRWTGVSPLSEEEDVDFNKDHE